MAVTINEYRTRLFAALNGFDSGEVRQAVDYYTELLEDADDPEAQMQSFGTPEQLAERIIRDNGWSRGGYAQNAAAYSGNKSEGSSGVGALVGRITALVLTSPFWITVFILILTVLLVMWCLFAMFPIMSIAGAVEFVRWITKFSGYAFAALFGGILCAGIAILLLGVVKTASVGLFGATKRFADLLFGGFFKSSYDSSDDFDMKKKRSFGSYFSKLALVIGAALTLVGGVVSVPLFAKAAASPEKFGRAEGLSGYEYDFGSSCDSVRIDLDGAASLNIVPSDSDRLYVTGENVYVEKVNAGGGSTAELSYKYEKRLTLFNIGTELTESRFTLHLPEKDYKSVQLDVSLGELTADGFSAEDIAVKNSCGSITLSGLSQKGASGSFNVENSLGSVKMNNCTSETSELSKALIDVKCGGIEINDTAVSALKIINDLGETTIGGFKADKAELKAACGGINISGTEITGSLNCGLDLGSADIDLTGDDYDVAAECSNGDVSVNGRSITESDHNGSIPVVIKCDNGDIDVDFR